MRLTLITVCFNSAAVIRTALESVLAQKGADVEYLVIDGGSTDGTAEILRSYEAKFGTRRYRWLSERDGGMYDALNKGIRMASGDAVGILNSDDALAADDVLARVAAAFEADPSLDGTYADIRFVRSAPKDAVTLAGLRALPAVRYCTGRYFRPWMFRFGLQTAHPSTFFRASCFAKWGGYSLDYGMFGDFELLCRFIWRYRARMRYLPACVTVMRLGGASTRGWQSVKAINRADLRALRDNGCRSNYLFLYSRYLFKVWGMVFRRRAPRTCQFASGCAILPTSVHPSGNTTERQT